MTAPGKAPSRFLVLTLSATVALAAGITTHVLMSSGESVTPLTPGAELLRQVEEQDKDCSMAEAIASGNVRVVLFLAHNAALLNRADEEGNTPLHLAARAGNSHIVSILLLNDANPLARNADKKLPSDLAANSASRRLCLHAEASRLREQDLIKRLTSGKDTDDAEAAVQQALLSGLDPNARSADGKLTLLGAAVQTASPALVDTLLRAGSKVNAKQAEGRTALHIAAQYGRADLIPILLRRGANPMAYMNNDATPLHSAIYNRRTNAVVALLPAYKNMNYNPYCAKTGFAVETAISRADVDGIKAMLDAGMDPNDPSMEHNPMLTQAVQRNRERIVSLLLKAGADKEARDKQGKRAADYARGKIANLLR